MNFPACGRDSAMGKISNSYIARVLGLQNPAHPFFHSFIMYLSNKMNYKANRISYAHWINKEIGE